MYPDLSYIFHALFGTPVDNAASVFKTFGFMLVMAILSAAVLFYIELKRKADKGMFNPWVEKHTVGAPATPAELFSNGFFGFLLGWKLPYIAMNFAEFKADAAGVVFSGKGTLLLGLLMGAVFAAWKYYEKKRSALPTPKVIKEKVFPHDRIGDITIIAAISGVIGAKVFALLEDLPAFFRDPIGMFFSGSGLAIYGGLIGGFFGVYWYLRKNKIAFWPVVDAVAPALIIAYGVGRMGCHLSGDGDWGIVASAVPDWWFLPDWMWSSDYMQNVNNDGVLMEGCDQAAYAASNATTLEGRCMDACGVRYCHVLEEKVYTTSIWETITSFAIGGFLWLIRKRTEAIAVGLLFCIYLFFNGVERFLIEKVRVNIEYDNYGGFTQAEIIAIGFMVLGIALGVWRYRKAQTTA